ncbi:MAG: phosphatidic acid phosphatase [Clostridia bacterium]|nr:phosphatidic acid phosphatase [Clostridia bacterium]
MKQSQVDYRQFRLSRINEPQYRHLWLLSGWVVYFILYFLTENLIPPENCHIVHCRLDDIIPFCEWFVIPYVFWYVFVAGSLWIFVRKDIESFKRLSVFIIITQAVAMAAYILYPSRQDLRPDVFPRQNVLTWILGLIYAFDTSTGVCPSLHVAYSIGIASVWLKKPDATKGTKLFVTVAAAVISIATAFVKQHSVVDIIAALPVCLLAELLVYGKWWKKKWRNSTL